MGVLSPLENHCRQKGMQVRVKQHPSAVTLHIETDNGFPFCSEFRIGWNRDIKYSYEVRFTLSHLTAVTDEQRMIFKDYVRSLRKQLTDAGLSEGVRGDYAQGDDEFSYRRFSMDNRFNICCIDRLDDIDALQLWSQCYNDILGFFRVDGESDL